MTSRFARLPVLLFSVGLMGCPSGSGSEGSDGESSGDAGESTETVGMDEGEEGDETETDSNDDSGDESNEFDPCEDWDCGDGTCFVSDDQAVCACDPGFTFVGFSCQPCGAPEGDSVAIDIQTLELAGTITVNGEAPPASEGDSGELWLVSPIGEDEVLLGSTADGAYQAVVVPGHYELWYRSAGVSHAVTPVNTNQRVQGATAIFAEGDFADIDLSVVNVEVDLRVGMEPAPQTPEDDGVLRLVGVGDTPGDEAPLGLTSEPAQAVPVLVGEYELIYSVDSAGSTMPANTNAVLGPVVLGPEPELRVVQATLDTVLLDKARFTLDGAAFPATASDSGNLLLRRGEDTVELGSTAEGGSVRVLDRIYEARFQSVSPGATPSNANVLFGEIDVGTDFSLDLRTSLLEFTLSVDGGAPPALDEEAGELWLHGWDDETDEFLLGQTTAASEARVAAGSYGVRFRAITAGVALPANSNALFAQVSADGDKDVALDLPTAFVDGPFTLDDAAPSADPEVTASIHLVDLESGDEALLGRIHEQGYGRRVIVGEYDVRYRYESGEGIPKNTDGSLGTLMLVADQSFGIDVPLRSSMRTVALNQGPAPADPDDSGTLALRGPGSVSAGSTTQESVMLDMLPGGYTVRYSSSAAGGLTPENSDADVACFTIE